MSNERGAMVAQSAQQVIGIQQMTRHSMTQYTTTNCYIKIMYPKITKKSRMQTSALLLKCVNYYVKIIACTVESCYNKATYEMKIPSLYAMFIISEYSCIVILTHKI